MAETDRREALFRSYGHAAGIVAGVSATSLHDPTPCPEYDVASLIDHLVGAAWRAAALGRGEVSTTDAFPHVELEAAPGELRRAAEDAEAAWSEDGRLAARTEMPWGEEYEGSTLVAMYLAELAGHAWDLAAATGQTSSLDPGLAAAALEGARSMLKPEYRDAMGKGNPFGAEVEPPADATDWERFAAFMGRPPRTWGEAGASS